MSDAHRTPEWRKARAQAAKIIRARLEAGEDVRCVDCGRHIYPEHKWDVGHIKAATHGGGVELSNLGASHRTCNRSAGGRLGAVYTNQASRRAKRLPTKW